MIGLVGIVANPPLRETSHNAGWTYVYLSQLQYVFGSSNVKVLTEDDDWDECDQLFVNEGVNWKPGVWNLIGGISEAQIVKLHKLNNFKGQISVWGHEVPDYRALCVQRLISCDFKAHIKSVNRLCPATSLVLGDSHAISAYEPGYDIIRVDFKTLHGFLKLGLRSFVPHETKILKFYAGNIDLRHHLCRFESPEVELLKLIVELEHQLLSLNADVTLVEWLPVEDESRVLPQTGYYKGTPFFGSWQLRHDLRQKANGYLATICVRNGWHLQQWPQSFQDESFKLKFDVMEARRSVHLAPKYYPWRVNAAV